MGIARNVSEGSISPVPKRSANDGGGRRPERDQRAKMVVVKTPSEGKPPMGKSIRNLSTVTRVGLDLAKRVFQVHAVEAKGEIVVARKLTRSQPDATAPHSTLTYSGRRLESLRVGLRHLVADPIGHEVRF